MTLEERIDRIIRTGYIELEGEAFEGKYKLLATRWKNGEAYQKSLAHIPEIIERMQFLEEMPPDKGDASFDKYSYYITPAKIDGELHTVLSTVGYKGGEIYYDHNVFKGTPKEVFAKARNEAINKKYDRLNKILQYKKG